MRKKKYDIGTLASRVQNVEELQNTNIVKIETFENLNYSNFLKVKDFFRKTVNTNKENIYQRRTDNHCLQIGMEEFDEDMVLARASRVGEQALELLDAEDCPTETTNLVLASDQMLSLIHI